LRISEAVSIDDDDKSWHFKGLPLAGTANLRSKKPRELMTARRKTQKNELKFSTTKTTSRALCRESREDDKKKVSDDWTENVKRRQRIHVVPKQSTHGAPIRDKYRKEIREQCISNPHRKPKDILEYMISAHRSAENGGLPDDWPGTERISNTIYKASLGIRKKHGIALPTCKYTQSIEDAVKKDPEAPAKEIYREVVSIHRANDDGMPDDWPGDTNIFSRIYKIRTRIRRDRGMPLWRKAQNNRGTERGMQPKVSGGGIRKCPGHKGRHRIMPGKNEKRYRAPKKGSKVLLDPPPCIKLKPNEEELIAQLTDVLLKLPEIFTEEPKSIFEGRECQ